MKVILKKPGKSAQPVELDNTLRALQGAVGGHIEAVTITKDLAILCNEEGRLLGMDWNVHAFGMDFVGPILIVGVDGEAFTDVPDSGVELLLRALR